MEELQDAIEDAQYMDAMFDDTPRPSKAWPWKTPVDLECFISKLKSDEPERFDIDSICRGSLGFYFFMKFARDHGSKILSEFIIETASLRGVNSQNTMNSVRKIVTNYMVDGSLGNPHFSRGHPSLTRTIPSSTSSNIRDIEHLYTDNSSKNALGINGEVIERVLSQVYGHSTKSNSSNNAHAVYAVVDSHVLDEVDCVVFHILKQRHLSAFTISMDYLKYFQFIAMSRKRLSEEEDFLLLRVVGRGGFGQVNACKKATTSKLYAMKMMSKKRIKLKKAERMCLTERDIMTSIDSPYVVCLKYSFYNATDLYLILDLMIGGDLGYHLGKKTRFSLRESKFYAARILLGVAALHDRQIVYRDLKPENILLDVEGYTKISDLGLACKMEPGGITGTCGTRGYWAPEMLRKTAEGKRERYFLSVDWFSFGCVLYEFLVGQSPFRTERAKAWGGSSPANRADKDKAIDAATLEMEPDYSCIQEEHAVSLLQGLLQKRQFERLGSRSYQDIIDHPFFADVAWDTLNTDKPPMKPGKDINVATQSEIGYFSDVKACKKVVLTAEDHKQYEGWDFTSQSAFQEEVVEFLTYEEIHGPIKPTNSSPRCCCLS